MSRGQKIVLVYTLLVMDIRQKITTAVPYLIFALLFVFLAGQASHGYCSAEEGMTLAIVERFCDGGVPFIDEWLNTQAFAVVLMPFFLLWMNITGSVDTVIYFFRLIYILFVFATSVVGYKVIHESTGRLVGTVAAAAAMLCLGSNNQGFSCYNFCALCLYISGLFGWCTWKRWREDDGSNTGYARILQPVACGAFACMAASCSLGILPLFAITIMTAAALAIILRDKRIILPFAWAGVGYLVVLLCFFIYLLGFFEPGKMAQSMMRAFVNSHGLIFSDAAQRGAALPAAASCVAILAFCFVIALGIIGELRIFHHTLWQDAGAVTILIIMVLCCWFTGVTGHSLTTDEDISRGVFTQNHAAIQNLTSGIDDGDAVWYVTENPTIYLDAPGKCAAPTVATALVSEADGNEYYEQNGHEHPEWVLVQNDSCIDDDSLVVYCDELRAVLGSNGAYAPVASNDFGTLYKRASKPSYINDASK